MPKPVLAEFGGTEQESEAVYVFIVTCLSRSAGVDHEGGDLDREGGVGQVEAKENGAVGGGLEGERLLLQQGEQGARSGLALLLVFLCALATHRLRQVDSLPLPAPCEVRRR